MVDPGYVLPELSPEASSSARWTAVRPVSPCSIWVRQLKPSASTAVSGSACRTRGRSTRSPAPRDTPSWPASKPKFPASPAAARAEPVGASAGLGHLVVGVDAHDGVLVAVRRDRRKQAAAMSWLDGLGSSRLVFGLVGV